MNQIDLKGRVAVVTGGAAGIGLAIVERLTASGAECCLWDRDTVRLEQTRKELRLTEKHIQEVDVANAASVETAAKRTLNSFSKVDILVNNAGIAGPSKKAWECTPEEWMQVLEVDLFSVYLCSRALIPSMIERKYGRIVNIASIAGKEGNPNATHYSAAKAGVIGFTKAVAKELALSGVIVNAVAPAVVETEILSQITQEHIDYMLSKIPMRRPGKKEEVAGLVAWLSSEECSFSTGAVYDISGGRATY